MLSIEQFTKIAFIAHSHKASFIFLNEKIDIFRFVDFWNYINNIPHFIVE